MEKIFKIIDKAGVHARPATILVSKANKFTSDISLIYRDKKVNLKSIMGVMSLGIKQNEEMVISVTGVDDETAIAELTETIVTSGVGVEVISKINFPFHM